VCAHVAGARVRRYQIGEQAGILREPMKADLVRRTSSV